MWNCILDINVCVFVYDWIFVKKYCNFDNFGYGNLFDMYFFMYMDIRWLACILSEMRERLCWILDIITWIVWRE